MLLFLLAQNKTTLTGNEAHHESLPQDSWDTSEKQETNSNPSSAHMDYFLVRVKYCVWPFFPVSKLTEFGYCNPGSNPSCFTALYLKAWLRAIQKVHPS